MLVNVEMSGKEYSNEFSASSKLSVVKKWFRDEINLSKDLTLSFKYKICNSNKLNDNLTMEEIRNNSYKENKEKLPLDTLKLYGEIDSVIKDNKCNIL